LLYVAGNLFADPNLEKFGSFQPRKKADCRILLVFCKEMKDAGAFRLCYKLNFLHIFGNLSYVSFEHI